MSELVVDASVAIKWFVPEVASDEAVALLHSGASFCAPDLIGPEIANTLWKKVGRGEVSADDALAIIGAFDKLGIEIFPSSALLPAALELAIATGRTAYDCLYVALAVARDCTLITADRKFAASLAVTPFADRVRPLGAN